jgi:hypothetical protein
MLDKTIIMSGTDPNRPRSAGNIVERLRQIQRDTAAMHAEALQLKGRIDLTQGVLADQGRSWAAAGDAVRHMRGKIDALVDRLSDAHEAAKDAGDAICDSGVNLSRRFEWRPTAQR